MLRKSFAPALCLAIMLAWAAATAQAQHVASQKLLPSNTLLYVHVTSVPDLVAAFKETNIGRMLEDPQVKPFMAGALDTANNMLVQVKERTGLSLEELARLPQGEMTFAMVPRNPNSNRTEPFEMAAILDCGDSIVAARKVSDKLRGSMEAGGYRVDQEQVNGFPVSLYSYGNGNAAFVMFERENTIVLCSDLPMAKQFLANWTEGIEDCLATNSEFVAAMDRCRGVKDEAPQVMFFVDPISIARETTRGTGAALVMAMLPALGLDGFLGIGGSVVLATEDFDSIFQIHVLLQSPRSGVLDLIAIEAGDDNPPAWVPADVASYMSAHWNFKDFYFKGTKLADSFTGEGATGNRVNDTAKRMLGVDFQHDIMPFLTGRLVHTTWFERPVRLGVGGCTMGAVQINDPKAFSATFDKIVSKFGGRIEKKTFSGATYYRTTGNNAPDDIQPRPCFAMLDDWVLVCDRPSMMEHILRRRDDGSDRLASDLEYKLVASKIGRQPGGKTPGLLSFTRPDESWKYMYDLAKSDKTRDTLRNSGQSNVALQALNKGLEKNPLPPWQAIAKYLAPGGSMAVSDDSGIHYMQFSLKRK